MYNKRLNIKLDQYDLWHYENVDLHKMLSLIARPIWVSVVLQFPRG